MLARLTALQPSKSANPRSVEGIGQKPHFGLVAIAPAEICTLGPKGRIRPKVQFPVHAAASPAWSSLAVFKRADVHAIDLDRAYRIRELHLCKE